MQLHSERIRQIPLWVAILAPALIAFAVFLNTVQNGFVYDDAWKIQLLPTVFPPWRELLSLRSITYFSQILDRMIWGDSAPGFHLTNVVLHAIASGLVALAAFSLAHSRRIALLTGLFFAVHPVHVEAVASFANRKDILAMIFAALALALWRSRHSPVLSYILAWSCFGFGFLSKEVAVIGLAPMFFLADTLLPQEKVTWGRRLQHAALRISPFALVMIGIGVIKGQKIFRFFNTDYIYGITDHQLETYQEVLANAAAAVPDLFRLLFWPAKLSADYPPIPDLRLTSPQALFGIALLLLWTTVAIFLVRRSPLATFSMLWPVFTYLACSNLVPLNRFFVAERYLYVPSFGICVLLALVFNRSFESFPKARHHFLRRVVISLIMLAVTAAGFRAVIRNRDWRDGPSLWTSELKSGNSTWRSHYNLGFELKKAGKYDLAADQFEMSLTYFPNRPEIEAILVKTMILAGRLNQAEALCGEILRLRSDHPDCHYALAVAYESRANLDSAIESSERALASDPNHLESLMFLARLYTTDIDPRARNGRRALELSERAWQITKADHDYPEALWAMARSYEALDELDQARTWAFKALNLARVRGMETISAQISTYLRELQHRAESIEPDQVIEPATPSLTPRRYISVP